MEQLNIVYITAASKEEAERIGDKLVEEKLAACVNIYENVTSIYMWEGKKEKSQEVVMVAKTKESLLPELEKKVKEMHSYSCPCIVAYPISFASEDFAEWIVSSVKKV